MENTRYPINCKLNVYTILKYYCTVYRIILKYAELDKNVLIDKSHYDY